MTVTPTDLPGVLLVEPRLFRDARGHFLETWNAQRYAQCGIGGPWTQDNVSVSGRGVLRGLHLQAAPHAQGKLVSVLSGAAYDVAVDVRAGSPTYGRHVAFELSSENGRQLWIPPGLAHGFVVLSETCVLGYKCTQAAYAPHAERTIRWNDPALGIRWPIADPTLAERDAAAPLLADADLSPVRP
jgi:dTDP-4-dehydrorhamnose 3,5-epimerase